ncbi:glycosyltransferase family 2 protein [Roseomonas alkaliterrae]|uniref:GT2 family glycosyltransferase n=1 Tax=Neoroseomonas alkaliterrae TaxID=1452450 RepID=A0A840Y008_9PROT|nr:GT2 family glycosyltransferase [Neoroseomonas alkaliterrae]MBR0676467.1 glycosyltransferase family 2 protein [Neoroseomonas alkaliterrae]
MDGPGAGAARVTVVTVTYRSAAAMEGFLAALPPGLPLIVVDNASGDGTAERIAAAAPQARLVRNPENRGFGAGCNAGLDLVGSEFALLLNPDARLAPGAVEALVAAADAWPDAAIIAPAIRGEDGAPVRSYDAAQQRRRLLPRRRGAEPWPEGPACVEFVSGAAMLLRSADGLRFDESLFLFYEDDEICAAARARGKAVVYVPSAVVTHAGGRSSAPSARIRWRKAFHMALSRQIFRARHGGGDAGARLAHHAGKALGHALGLRWGRLIEDAAGFAGTLAWLRRRRTGR